jgi:cytochrome P450
VDEHVTALTLVHPGKHLDKRRLASPVLAQKGVNLTRPQVETHPAQCLDDAETYGDVPEIDQ